MSECCDSASFDGKMVGTAVLLMIHFFAKPIVFDIVNRVERNEVWTAHMEVMRRLPVALNRLYETPP